MHDIQNHSIFLYLRRHKPPIFFIFGRNYSSGLGGSRFLLCVILLT
eukprot:UN00845